MSNGIVHWRDRRLTRIGLRRFLLLVGSIVYNHQRAQPRWQKLYESNRYATTVAERIFHVRLPSSYSATDRAWVKWYAANHPSEVPADVKRWARRGDAHARDLS